MKTIKEIAEKYNVTDMAVRHWIKDGNIKVEWEKVIGIRPRMIVDEKDIERYLNSKSTI